ncbi:DEAD/DEAH box helicase family protein [Hymenobacter norwichensis]|uniref:restriction endonuclease n=1 Tax=Hymenobacter norwichensis TaxID=223903 RepID=UPI0003B56502|nr:DEAD/DEAH box helicase family protein [Hymenobacter norwichensis]
MILQLETLPYQQQAIDSVLGLFEGQPRNSFATSFLHTAQINRCDLTPDELHASAKRIMLANGLDPATSGHLDTAETLTTRRDFCIEMETGTGKTLVYLQTLYKLHQDFGFSKFIIIVPSVAIRAGVVGTMDNFSDQLAARYGFRLGLFAYDSKRLNKVRDFVSNPAPQVMVTTIQSFTSDTAILNQSGRDNSIDGLTYLQALGRTRPIIVMDEPQEGMDTENALERLQPLNALATLRYSATHKVLRNRLYRLTPYDSYREGLVKKIEVLTVAEKGDEGTLKLTLLDVDAKLLALPKAKLEFWKRDASGNVKLKESTWLKKGDKLSDIKISNNPSYAGYEIDRIWKPLGKTRYRISFTNGVELEQGQKAGDLEGLFRLQLRYLLLRHFQKRATLHPKGIKCLALVFIDTVANYVGEQPLIKTLFEEEYRAAYAEHNGGTAPTPEQVTAVQGYYFAAAKKNPAPEDYTDSAAKMASNGDMYRLILKEKGKLLSLDNPVEIIFTHSALGVGWDNPNIFTIATLNQSYSDIKKRQEIGRGLRLCVNQEGQRQRDLADTPEGEEMNLLTVVPNETYQAFVSQYQDDLREADGQQLRGAPMRHQHKDDKATKKTVRRNDKLFNSADFQEFWRRLARRTDYTVHFSETDLIREGATALATLRVPPYEAEVTLVRIQSLGSSEKDIELVDGGSGEAVALSAQLAPIDAVEELSEGSGLAYTTVLGILQQLPAAALRELATNPVRWVQLALPHLRRVAIDTMLRGLEYRVLPTGYSAAEQAAMFPPTWETFSDNLAATPQRGLYDQMQPDSDVEADFALDADRNAKVVCFLKFPDKYRIPVPGGRYYEPDWGIVYQRKKLGGEVEDTFYFVVETKGTNTLTDPKALTEDEKFKMECATRHFAALGLEAHIRYAAPIKDFGSFETRIQHPGEADHAPVTA